MTFMNLKSIDLNVLFTSVDFVMQVSWAHNFPQHQWILITDENEVKKVKVKWRVTKYGEFVLCI